MFAYLLNTKFEAITLIETYESFIWTDRYREYGDFEITCFPDSQIVADAKIDYYLVNPESEHVMIIEGREIDTDAEEGDRFIITGRSLESILDRRIVWKQTDLSGSLQNGIKKLITDAFISPSVSDRKVSNFVFETSTDPEITKLTHEAQYTGDNLYDILKELCEEYDIGFKITLNSKNQFVFKLYKGEDRSYDQTENTFVVFSPGFDNIIDTQYAETTKEYKNIAWVGGEGEGSERKFQQSGTEKGLTRRELFVDAREVSKKDENDVELTDAEYNKLLKQRGDKDLLDYPKAKTFAGKVDTTSMFVYGVDFNLGDVVQLENEYGIEGPSLVTEIVWTQDEEGYSCYPTFMSKDEENGKESDA